MTAEETGIAATQNAAPTATFKCGICGKPMESPFAARAGFRPGWILVLACSEECKVQIRTRPEQVVDQLAIWLNNLEQWTSIPDDTPVLSGRAWGDGRDWCVTAGMIRRAVG